MYMYLILVDAVCCRASSEITHVVITSSIDLLFDVLFYYHLCCDGCLYHLARGCLGTLVARSTATVFAGAAGETGVARPLDFDSAYSYNDGLAPCSIPGLPSRPPCL